MAYDDIINNKQGSIKASEIFIDRQLDIVKNSIGETALKTLEGIMKPVADALRYNNMLLHSDGQIIWENNLGQPRIRFNADAKANNIRLRLMMLDESAQSRTVDIIIPATTGVNSLTAFNTINMNNNELIYMELSRSVILAAVSGTPLTTPAEIILQNGIDGGSVLNGQRLLKTSMTGAVGMPAMVADLDSILQDSSQTVNIPIAARYDWTDGVDTFSDIWWIPHGIRWPIGSISVVGAVVVSGFEAMPNYFARTVTELSQQLTLLSTTGGMICVIDAITINSPLTVPEGVTIIGRTNKNDNTSPGLYFANNGKLIMGARSSLKNLYIRGLAGFGQLGTEHIIEIATSGVTIEECFFEFVSNTSTQGRGINFLTGAQDFRINKNLFVGQVSSTRALQFSAASYVRANLSSNQFTVLTEAVYSTREAALNINNSYGVVPIGTILPWVGSAFINGSNSTPNRIAASYAALATMLPEGWVICDGRQLPTDSPLNNGGAIYTPNMTDRFVIGVNALSSGVVGGTNSVTLSAANLPSHQHSIDHGHSAVGALSNAVGPHSHEFSHVHQWGYKTNSASGGSETLWTKTSSSYKLTQTFTSSSSTSVILNAVSSAGGKFGGAATGGKDDGGNTDGAWYTAGPINAPYTSFFGSTYTGGNTPAINGLIQPDPSVTVGVNGMTGNSGFTGSGSSFSVTPNYLSAVYIMRYK